MLIGIYKDSLLIKKYSSNEKTSDVLPKIFHEILTDYEISAIFYAKGPGSFMSIKISYLFLKTISISKNIPFYGAEGFNFNKNSPIKSVGTLYFIKKNGNITTYKLNKKTDMIKPFELPQKLNTDIFTSESQPLYVLPAV